MPIVSLYDNACVVVEASPSKRRRRSVSQPHLTLAKTPTLATRTRSRPTHVKSQQQLEEEELQEHQKLVTSNWAVIVCLQFLSASKFALLLISN